MIRGYAGRRRGFCMCVRTNMSLYLWATRIHIERIKNLVAPALIIERSLPCN